MPDKRGRFSIVARRAGCSRVQKGSEVVFPRGDGRAHLVDESVSLVHADDASEDARLVIEKCFNNFDIDAAPLKANGKGAAAIVQRVAGDA
jgi:hypothetical protein